LRDFTKRDEVVIATKLFNPMRDDPNGRGLSRKAVMIEVENSLKRLGADYIDLYQIHRWDYTTPIEETMEALHDVVKSGKARYIGASSMFAWQFSKALYTSKINRLTPFASMQNHYNLIYREEEREMMPLCQDQGVAVIPWSPLARGFLAGNRGRQGGETARANSDDYAKSMYYQDDDFAVADRLADVAKARGVSNMKVALAWVLSKPFVTAPIVGTSKPHHLNDALAALELKLSDEEVKKLEEPYKPHRILGHS